LKKYDLAVIGSGSAGMNLIRAAAAKGWQCALAESGYLGGTCINVGCIPSKTLIYSARVMRLVSEANIYGVTVNQPEADWPAMVHRKNRLVGRIRNRTYSGVEKNRNIDLFEGEATFSSPQELNISGDKIFADKIVIAAGTRPAIPPVSGLDKINYLTSTTAMEMDELPESIIILGGGIIALEFSQLFHYLGVKVTILQRNQRLAPVLDADISAEIQKIMTEEGIEVITSAEIRSVGNQGSKVYAEDYSRGSPVRYSAEKLLIATGRISNGDRLALDEAEVETDERGFIKVDSSFKTSRDGIWAIGDITGGPMFTHRAWHDGMLLGKHLVEGTEITNDGRLIPFAVFTSPEIATVGMLEKEAIRAGYDARVQRFEIGHLGRALSMEQYKGFVKLVSDRKSGKLLGAHLLTPEAGELIHELIMAIRLGATIENLKDMMHVHPTLSESISNTAWTE